MNKNLQICIHICSFIFIYIFVYTNIFIYSYTNIASQFSPYNHKAAKFFLQLVLFSVTILISFQIFYPSHLFSLSIVLRFQALEHSAAPFPSSCHFSATIQLFSQSILSVDISDPVPASVSCFITCPVDDCLQLSIYSQSTPSTGG